MNRRTTQRAYFQACLELARVKSSAEIAERNRFTRAAAAARREHDSIVEFHHVTEGRHGAR